MRYSNIFNKCFATKENVLKKFSYIFVNVVETSDKQDSHIEPMSYQKYLNSESWVSVLRQKKSLKKKFDTFLWMCGVLWETFIKIWS